ncbi:MAG TPA: 50S ribosomal protein L10 [bacterium]|nr:50S ribosomal protein L10 [bacterium]HPJ72609.1 50S ribosomal protein L10 [bacterium]HPQ66996.1 50S ribosomal protein L10 [bacterium]
MRPEKQWIHAEYVARLESSRSVAVAEYSGLSADAINDLRRELEKLEADVMVVKNRLFRRALADTRFQPLGEYCSRQTAVVFGGDDIPGIVKFLINYSAEAGSPKVSAAMWGEDLFTEGAVRRLSELPGRDELLGRVVGGVQAPLAGFVGVLNRLLSGLAVALQGIADKKSGAAG